MGPGRDLYALRKDGSELPVEIGLNSIDTDEGPVVLAAVIDISERKQREEHVRAALREKELLLGEIHHRVKNNLQLIDSLIDLQTFRVQDAEALAALRDSQNRIRSMLLIHQTLYLSKDFARVDLQAFLKTLLPALMESYTTSADRIELHIDAEQVQLPINAAVPCGLVVNELVTNSLKHAFPGELRGNIWVELSLQPDREVRLSISNDGVPIPEDLDFSRSTSLGMKLVSLLTDQMQGRLEIQRAAPTRFLVQFPLEGR
jgi:two-component sensor histidine kinase